MLRSEIPAGLAKARAADVARIPLAALAKMTPADVAPRLQAADEMRRRARARGLPGDQARMLFDMASEVLATDDPECAAAIIKAAGVTGLNHDPMTGTHTHEHVSFGLPGEAPTHSHEHTHDDNHEHRHEHAGKSAKAAAPRPGAGWAPLRKDIAPVPAAAGRSVSVDTPALGDIADAKSFDDGLTKLNRQGRLGQAARELALVADAAMALKRGSDGDAERYDRMAGQVSDPELAKGYRELAAKARQEVRAAWA